MRRILIRPRRGTAAEWAAVNPILADGELGLVSDSRGFKVGDGATLFNDLPFHGRPDNLSTIASLTGGLTSDAQARDTINEILSLLQSEGFIT